MTSQRKENSKGRKEEEEERAAEGKIVTQKDDSPSECMSRERERERERKERERESEKEKQRQRQSGQENFLTCTKLSPFLLPVWETACDVCSTGIVFSYNIKSTFLLSECGKKKIFFCSLSFFGFPPPSPLCFLIMVFFSPEPLKEVPLSLSILPFQRRGGRQEWKEHIPSASSERLAGRGGGSLVGALPTGWPATL